jgi:hypothetical protein
MTTSYPTSLDNFTNPTGSDTLASPDHAGQHADINDAVEALQTKVGVDSSAVVTSLDYKVAQKATIPVTMRGSTLSLPGVILTAEVTAQSLAAQIVLYFPIVVPTGITLSEISANVTTASVTAGCKSRIAIYNANELWVPTTLVLDCGEIACDSTGVKTLSMTQSLSAGRYYIRLHGDNSASRPSFYCYRGSPITGTLLGSTTQFISAISKTSQTYAVAEATVAGGNLPSNGSSSTAPFIYFVRSVWS